MLRTFPQYTVVLSCVMLAEFAAFTNIRTAVLAGPSSKAVPVVLLPENLEWKEEANGVKVAILYGDPAQSGPFVLRVQYPPGFRKSPHTHPHDAFVTVLSGSYYRGYGNRLDKSQGVRLTPGTFSVNPEGVSHYEWADEPAMLEVHATGPWRTTYVDEEGRQLN